MPDREKVIADIEEQIAWIRDNDFHKFHGWGHAVLAMKDAIDMLKEQEPVEPFCWNDDYGQHWKCGHCGKVIGANDKYCHECGRPVKHNEQQRT